MPWVLRKHLYVFGLTTHGQARGGDSVLDERETVATLSRELPRYRTALLDGTLLKRVPNVEAFFVIENSGNWDQELRDGLTAQLEDPKARETFASLLVPPGFGVNPDALEGLLDVPQVASQMEQNGEGRPPGETWLEKCLARLRRSLEGRETIGWNGEDEQ